MPHKCEDIDTEIYFFDPKKQNMVSVFDIMRHLKYRKAMLYRDQHNPEASKTGTIRWWGTFSLKMSSRAFITSHSFAIKHKNESHFFDLKFGVNDF